MAKKIMQRIDEMKAAENLEVLMKLPGRHHPLEGDKKGIFACDLKHPYRLLYLPLSNNKSGKLNYSEIKEIVILEIVDYH